MKDEKDENFTFEEKLVSEFTQLRLEEVLWVTVSNIVLWRPSLVLNENGSEILSQYELLESWPESSIFNELSISKSPNSLRNTFSMQIFTLFTDNWEENFFISFSSSKPISLQYIESISGECNWQINFLAWACRLQYIKQVGQERKLVCKILWNIWEWFLSNWWCQSAWFSWLHDSVRSVHLIFKK